MSNPNLVRLNSGALPVPATLSPSSWARASVPIYPGAHPQAPPAYSGAPGEFSGSNRFLVPAPAAANSLTHPLGRYSEPLSLRGNKLFIHLAIIVHFGLWLVRDSSLTSFLLYSVFVTLVLYFFIVRGEPFSLAFVVESPASLQTKANSGNSSSSSSSNSSSTNSANMNNTSPSSSSPTVATSSQTSYVAKPTVATAPYALNKPLAPTAWSGAETHLPVEESKTAPASSSTSTLNELSPPQIDLTNQPLTPSVEPAITPLPARSLSAEAAHPSTAIARIPSETPVVVAGATARCRSDDAEDSWCRASGASYDVRIGPNYKKYGKKAQSKPALFECVGIDIFGAPNGKLDNIAQHLQLPWIAKKKNADPSIDPFVSTAANPQPPPEQHEPLNVMDPILKASDDYEIDPEVLRIDEELGVPTLFIINFQIPTYSPSWIGGGKEDGEGFSILLYYQITLETRQEIKSGKLSGAVQLFKDFVNNAHAFEYHSRFKAIPRIVNPSDAKVNFATRTAMKAYNSKPFLTGPHCHAFIRGPGYMEADIDVHRFCLSARKGAYGTLDAMKSLIVDIGFVIEGGRENCDDELPEQILGCTHVAHVDPLHAKSFAFYLEQGKKEREKRQRGGQ